jgi:hypothetical protein
MAHFRCLVVLSVVLSFVIAASVLAAETPSEKKPQPSVNPEVVVVDHEAVYKPSAQKRIDEALKSPTQFAFVEVPLDKAVDNLKKYHKIEIQIDRKALEDLNVATNVPVTKSVRGVSLRAALRLLLKDLCLTWIIRDEVLLITTLEEADNQLDTKVLDVADLVVCRDKDGKLWDDYDTLIDAITSVVKPATWEQLGGPGSITGASLSTAKVLIVSQTQDAHEQIAELLAYIRAVARANPNGELPRRTEPTVPAKPADRATPGQGSGHGGTGGMGMF